MSLIKKLSQLASPNPIFLDPEDEGDDTSAKLLEKGTVDETIHVSSTKLQRQAAHSVEDEDKRYVGTPVSRKQALEDRDHNEVLISDDDDDDSSEDIGSELSSKEEDDMILSDSAANQDEEDSEGEELEKEDESDSDSIEDFKQQINSKNQDKTFEFVDDGNYNKYADDDEDVSEGSSDESDEGEDKSSDDEIVNDGRTHDITTDEGGIQSFSTTNLSDEISKGQAAKAQIGLWDNLLEYRIRLQKLLVIINQLPQPNSWGQFATEGGDEYQEALKQSEEALKHLLDQLTQLQTILLLQYSDTKKIAQVMQSENNEAASTSKSFPSKLSESDEEIPSDEEHMMAKGEADEEAEEMKRQQLKRKIKMGSYPEFLEKRHKSFQPFRDETIQKWYDKTRVASGKLGKGFSAFESSALKQITQILSDKGRLIKRTQLKRSAYTILGKQEKVRKIDDSSASSSEEEDKVENASPLRKDHLKEYDEEIFDDDDFYHQLLRQLIERKMADVNDPIALSRQWLEMQKLRSKVKKNVDTKASKGRKIRYDVHTKLVNFMAPFDTCKWADQARNDLYNSLFGKRSKGSTLNEEQTDR